MTHFDVFEIPPSFFPDQASIRANYYALSRLYHPDLQGASSETTESEMLKKSSELNNAYKVLGSFELLVPYVLRLEGILNEEEKASVSPLFLMEMMDVNESLMEAKMEEDHERIASIAMEVTEIQEQIKTDWTNLCRRYDQNHDKALLEQIKDYYLRNKYINRLKEQLGT